MRPAGVAVVVRSPVATTLSIVCDPSCSADTSDCCGKSPSCLLPALHPSALSSSPRSPPSVHSFLRSTWSDRVRDRVNNNHQLLLWLSSLRRQKAHFPAFASGRIPCHKVMPMLCNMRIIGQRPHNLVRPNRGEGFTRHRRCHQIARQPTSGHHLALARRFARQDRHARPNARRRIMSPVTQNERASKQMDLIVDFHVFGRVVANSEVIHE